MTEQTENQHFIMTIAELRDEERQRKLNRQRRRQKARADKFKGAFSAFAGEGRDYPESDDHGAWG